MQQVDAERARELSLFRPLGTSHSPAANHWDRHLLPRGASTGPGRYHLREIGGGGLNANDLQVFDRPTPLMQRLMWCDSLRLPKELVWLLQVQWRKFVAPTPVLFLFFFFLFQG